MVDTNQPSNQKNDEKDAAASPGNPKEEEEDYNFSSKEMHFPLSRNILLSRCLQQSMDLDMEQEDDDNFLRSTDFILRKYQKKKHSSDNGLPVMRLPKGFHVTHTDSEKHFQEWIQREVLEAKKSHVGFDAEWDWNSHKKIPAHLIQISTDEAALLFSTGGMYTKCVEQFFQDTSIKKVFIGAKQDMKKVMEHSKENSVASLSESIIDLEIDQGDGASSLVTNYLKKQMKKDQKNGTFSRWSRLLLDEYQLEYAALDAYLTYCLYSNETMQQRIEENGGCATELYKLRQQRKEERRQQKKLLKKKQKEERREARRQMIRDALEDQDELEACEE